MTAVAAIGLVPVTKSLDGVWQAYEGASTYYPFTHLNGFSAWFLTNPLAYSHLSDNLLLYYTRDNSPMLVGLTARTIGAIMLAAVWIVTMRLLSRAPAETSHPAQARSFRLAWAARVLPVAFFVLSTQMHERYLVPALAIWAWTASPDWRWWTSWLALAACATINILWTWPGPPDAWWISLCERTLHRPILTLVPGTWCASALIMLLALSLFEFPRHRDQKLRPLPL